MDIDPILLPLFCGTFSRSHDLDRTPPWYGADSRPSWPPWAPCHGSHWWISWGKWLNNCRNLWRFFGTEKLPKVSLIAKGNVFVFDFAISEDIYCLFPSAYFLLSASGDWRNNAPRRLQQPSARQGTPARRGFLAAPLRFWDTPTTTTQWHASHAVHVRLSLVSLKNWRSTWHWEWFQDTSAELPEIRCNIKITKFPLLPCRQCPKFNSWSLQLLSSRM